MSGSVIEGTVIQGTVIDGSMSIPDSDVMDAPATEGTAQYESLKPTLDDDAALLTVAVPVESARVTVNGHETSSDGLVRQFMSRGLKEGYLYTYEVVVTYEAEGQTREDVKTIKLRPGDTERLVFLQQESEAEKDELDDVSSTPASVETVVQLFVPADAQVTLAGNPTNGEGSVRTFRTHQLAPGQSWTDYAVEVVAKVNGKTQRQRRVINVDAGTEVQLRFDFPASNLAMR